MSIGIKIERNEKELLQDMPETLRINFTPLILSIASVKSLTSASIDELKASGLKTFLSVGIDKSDIKFNSVEVEHVEDAILQISETDDLVVLSESEDDKRETWFTSIHETNRNEIESSLLLIFQETTRPADQTEQEAAEEVVSEK